jgi:hypothetical protein
MTFFCYFRIQCNLVQGNRKGKDIEEDSNTSNWGLRAANANIKQNK